MKNTAWFWHFWRITPSEYRQLTVAEHRAMTDVMKDVAKDRRKAAAKRR